MLYYSGANLATQLGIKPNVTQTATQKADASRATKIASYVAAGSVPDDAVAAVDAEVTSTANKALNPVTDTQRAQNTRNQKIANLIAAGIDPQTAIDTVDAEAAKTTVDLGPQGVQESECMVLLWSIRKH